MEVGLPRGRQKQTSGWNLTTLTRPWDCKRADQHVLLKSTVQQKTKEGNQTPLTQEHYDNALQDTPVLGRNSFISRHNDIRVTKTDLLIC